MTPYRPNCRVGRTFNKESKLVSDLKVIAAAKGHVVVGTHDGKFHADDILAVAILKYYLKDVDLKLIRSRNKTALGQADILVDVGDGQYDHHSSQRFHRNRVPYAACGLIFEDCELNWSIRNIVETELIYAVEAVDNNACHEWACKNKLGWVAAMNPTHLEERTPEAYNRAFLRTLDIVSGIFERIMAHARARISARRALDACQIYCGFIIIPDPGGLPWIGWCNQHPEILGACTVDLTGRYIIHAGRNTDSPGFRVTLPRIWLGKCGAELQRISGLRGILDCPIHGNMVVCDDFETAKAIMRTLKFAYDCGDNGDAPVIMN